MGKKKVVILTGASNHPWQKTTPILEQMLEESGKIEVDVVINPERLTKERLEDYDIILSNWNAFGEPKPAPWSDELKKSYVDFVRNGGGHVVVHAGSASFYDWDDYHAICSATWGDGTGHVDAHEFEVRISKPDHPAVKGLSDFKTTDELWFRSAVRDDATVIAESFSKTTKNWEPTAVVNEFGKGRCFCLLLGHDDWFMKQGEFKTLLINGTEWVAELR